MGEAITIRALGPADLDLLLTLPDGVFDHPVLPEQAAAFLADPGHEMVVALVDGIPVGFASATVLLHPDKPPALFVNEVGVRDDWRRRGIATRLMKRLIALGRDRGCVGTWLGTEPDNEPALGLYRKLGGEELMIVGFAWDGAFDED